MSMSIRDNKALIRGFYGLEADKVPDALDDTFHTDFVRHGLQGDVDRETYAQYVAANLVAFPDTRYTLHDIVAEGDQVAVRWTLHATHKAEFNGIPPTNKVVTLSGVYIDRVKDGKIIEEWVFYNPLALMQQLSAAPTPGGSEE
jgi:steroid delta-isomerase-like uncharacterized protein